MGLSSRSSGTHRLSMADAATALIKHRDVKSPRHVCTWITSWWFGYIQYEWRLISRRARYSISYAPSREEQIRSFHSGIIPYRSWGAIKRRFLFKSPRTYEVRSIRRSDKIPPHTAIRHWLTGTETFRESPAHGSLVSSSSCSSSSRGFSRVKTWRNRGMPSRDCPSRHRDFSTAIAIPSHVRKCLEIQ